MSVENIKHIPVMLDEVIQALSPQKNQIIIDATFGGGGYSRALLEKTSCQVIGIDRDPEAYGRGQLLEIEFPGRFTIIHANFSTLAELKDNKIIPAVDGIVFDFGLSTNQLDTRERGFSFQSDGPLDMRMSKEGLSAEDLLMSASEKELYKILKDYGEEPKAKSIARLIIEERALSPIKTTKQLVDIIKKAYPFQISGKKHPATRSFQALRIAVNNEIDEIEKAISSIDHILKIQGRLVCVSFHSLEDRCVKSFLRDKCDPQSLPSRHTPHIFEAFKPQYKRLWKGTYGPSNEEIKRNPRARSAKMRGAERLNFHDIFGLEL